MAWVAADWSIDKDTKVIDYIGDDHTRFAGSTPSYATVIELHRQVQDLADDATYAGDDEMDITIVGATERSTDNIITMLNGWTITATAAEHLYDGSIIQSNGDTIYDGIVNFGNTTNIQIIQNGAVLTDDWWNTGSGGLNEDTAAGISHRFMLLVRSGGADIDGRRLVGTSRNFNKTYSEFKINGSTNGNNVLALSESDDLNNPTAAGTVSGWSDVTNTEGYSAIDANGDATPENYYSDWEFGSRTVNQFYERLKWLTREGTSETVYGINGELFRGITHQIAVDTPTGTFSAVEAVSWSGGTGQMLAINSTTAATLMWIQLLTGVPPTDGQTITGGSSSATVDVNVTVTERTVSAPFVGVSTGSAIIGAYGVGIGADDLTSADKVTDLTNQVRTPPNNVTFTVTGLVSGEDRVLVGPLGYRFAYDGEASGPFVVGELLTFDTPATATLMALQDDGTTGYMVISEPITGTVPANNATISGGTSAATAAVNGTPVADIAVRQFTLATALTTDNITAVQINTTVPSDTPTTGTIRVADNNGLFRLLDFDTLDAADTFSITTTNGNEDFGTVNASVGNKVWISYIDKLAASTQESFTGVYTGSDRNLFVRVRDGDTTPIKPFETTGTLGSAGGSATTIRTSDE